MTRNDWRGKYQVEALCPKGMEHPLQLHLVVHPALAR